MSPRLKSILPTLLKIFIILTVVLGFVAFYAISTQPNRADAQQTIIIGQTRLAPDSPAAMRVVVQKVGSGQPVPGAQVKVSLKPADGKSASLFQGVTGDDGSVPVAFRVPAGAEGQQQLIVETKSSAGKDRLEQPVTIQREYRLLLSTDKPLYQPGQIIHIRALALSLFDLAPARGATVNFLVEDAKGNKVFRQSVQASEFGVAAVDFALADMVNQGNYKLSAAIGDTASEKTVEVRPYVLPKFGVDVTTARSFYTPGQRVEGVVQSDYFFGKPVIEGEVELIAVIYDVERVEVAHIQGQTDANGTFNFSFDLPDYLAGAGLDSQQAQVGLEVSVIDQTDHPEQTSLALPVSEQPIIIEAVAESGSLRPGVENIVYVLTAYPDGSPAPTELRYAFHTPGQEQIELTTAATGEYGLAELRFTPGADARRLTIEARDAAGAMARREIDFDVAYGSDTVLLRTDRAAYVVGETMNLTALTPVNAGSIYLDIVKEGQTLSTRSMPVKDGRVDFVVDVSPDLYGALELHAYKVLLDGTIVRDTRLVVVDEARDIAIAISAGKDTYLPGEEATIDFHTTAQTGGAPVQTVLGVAIVDESVFALQRQDPGFAKLYFMLEAELMEPFYQLKGFELPAAYTSDQTPLRAAQDASAQAAWAGAPAAGLNLQINTRPDKMAALRQKQSDNFNVLNSVVLLAIAAVPLLLWLVVVLTLRGSGLIKRSLLGLLKVSGLLLLIYAALFGLLTFLDEMRWRWNFLRRLDLEEILPVVFGLALLVSLLGLAIYAWRRRDEAAKFIFLLTVAWAALLFLLVTVIDEGSGEPSEPLMFVALFALLLSPGAYLLYGQKLWAEKKQGSGWLATTAGSIIAIPALLVPMFGLFSYGAMSSAPPMVRNTTLVQDEVVFEMAATLEGAEKSVAIEQSASAESAGEAASAQAPRLRQFFPETLYWNPETLTDEAGFARVQLPMADSITTWRLTALASSQDGRLGFATQGIRVFQDFFVDVDLPVSLTQGDEISIPVGVFNYLPDVQEVRLVVEEEAWFELLGPAEQTLTIAANDIDVVYFPIRVREFGQQGFQVTAWGEKSALSGAEGASDAVRRSVKVLPDGKEIRLSDSNWLRENTEIALNLPDEVIPRTPYVEVKIYGGALAQVVEGLEKILRLPHG